MTVLQDFYKESVNIKVLTGAVKMYVTSNPIPTSGWLVVNPQDTIKREIVYFDSIGSDGQGDYVNLTIRGIGGTTEQSHEAGEPVRMNITAEHWAELVADTGNKIPLSYLDTDENLGYDVDPMVSEPSDTKIPSQKAVFEYLQNNVVFLTGDQVMQGQKDFQGEVIILDAVNLKNPVTLQQLQDVVIAGASLATDIIYGLVKLSSVSSDPAEPTVLNAEEVLAVDVAPIAGKVVRYDSNAKIPQAGIPSDSNLQGKFIDKFYSNFAFRKAGTVSSTDITNNLINSLGSTSKDGTIFYSSTYSGNDMYVAKQSLSGDTFSTITASTQMGDGNDSGSGTYMASFDTDSFCMAFGMNSSNLTPYLIINSVSTFSYAKTTAITMAGANANQFSYNKRAISSTVLKIIASPNVAGVSTKIFTFTRTTGPDAVTLTNTVTIANPYPTRNVSSSFFLSDDIVAIFYQLEDMKIYDISSGSAVLITSFNGVFVNNSNFISGKNNNEFFNITSNVLKLWVYDPIALTMTQTFGAPLAATATPSWSMQFPSGDYLIASALNDHQIVSITTSGVENAIEDLDAQGRLGYMLSDNSTDIASSVINKLIIEGSTNNDGTYSIGISNANKVILTSNILSVEETDNATAKRNLSLQTGNDVWMVKGDGNYYHGNDSS